MAADSIIGTRIAIVGSSGSGKSTVGEQLAEALELSFVELDALYWKPGWVGSEPEEFASKVEAATSGEGWIVAGNYHQAWPVYWPRVDTVVWLDLPLPLCLSRIVARSWRRARRRELLWETNYERFWPQLKVWSPNDSLLAWTVTRRRGLKQQVFDAVRGDPAAPSRVVRLRSSRDIDHFLRLVAPARGTS